jgi:hypothetical protein
MITNNHTQAGLGQSAKIYQFPVGGRGSPSAYRDTAYREAAGAAELMALRISDALSGCWYHEAAIEEAAAPAKA